VTYRDRREARADRLEEWATKREVKATAGFDRAHTLGAAIPFGQPILVGHHSEGRDRNYRARIASTMDRACADADKAGEMTRKAAGIRAAADRAIYSDDHDAAKRLAAKIAELEAARDRINAYNASCRKGTPDPALLDDRQRRDLLSVATYAPYQLRKGGQFPAYATSNLTGVITTTRKRLALLEAESSKGSDQ
jgi:hypothetical protein